MYTRSVWCILLISLVYGLEATEHTYNIVETEMFAIQISPNLFNWTYQQYDHQYRFKASLMGKPELPSWLKYIYSARHHSGFIYGTPPKGTRTPVMLLVIGINHQDFEARKLFLLLKIQKKEKVAIREVEMKIDNLNVEDLLDDHRMARLKDIFRNKLWPESKNDLYATFLSSAIDMGARLPLRPNEGEGVVVRVGSFTGWSSEVRRLREEVRPLSRLSACPRDYKRTTVERQFREHGFTMDWCNFQLYNTIYNNNGTTIHVDYLSEIPSTRIDKVKSFNDNRFNAPMVWSAPRLADLPSRDYLRDFIVAVVVPVLLMLLSIAGLTGVLCFRYAGVKDEISDRFVENAFNLCTGGRKSVHKSNVEVCRFPQEGSTTHLSATNSQNNTLSRQYSPKSSTNLAGDYNRPQPPPYLGTKRTNADAIQQRNLALEESIKLLNDANIANFKMIDYADGCDDYVPIKPVTGPEPVQTGFAVLDGDLGREMSI